MVRTRRVSGATAASRPRRHVLTAAAVTLGAHGAVQIETAQQAAEALRPLGGELAGLLLTAGIVGTGLLAVPVLAALSALAVLP